MGRGIAEPVDDLRVSNPPSNPALLDALASDFVANGYDLSRLVQTIAESRTYQLSSHPTDVNRDDDRLFSHGYVKPLPPQVLADAIAHNPPANAGAFVALSPVNGDVYAMGSLPTFNPNVFAKAISKSTYQRLNNPASNFPLINRAVQSVYPTGSTFKPITATAALESKAWSVGDTFNDHGQFLHLRPMPPQLGQRRRRHTGPGQRTARLLRRLLLQPRRAHQRRQPVHPAERRRVAALGGAVRHRTPDRDRPRRRGDRQPALTALARAHRPRSSVIVSSVSGRTRATDVTAPAGSPTAGRGRSETTSTSRSARETSR